MRDGQLFCVWLMWDVEEDLNFPVAAYRAPLPLGYANGSIASIGREGELRISPL
jgi:hypothetical protein